MGNFAYANRFASSRLLEIFGDRPYGVVSNLLLPPTPSFLAHITRFEKNNMEGCSLVIGLHLRYGKGTNDFYFPSFPNSVDVGYRVAGFVRSLIDLKGFKNGTGSCVFLATDTIQIRSSFPSKLHPATRVITQGYDARPDGSALFNAAFDQVSALLRKKSCSSHETKIEGDAQSLAHYDWNDVFYLLDVSFGPWHV